MKEPKLKHNVPQTLKKEHLFKKEEEYFRLEMTDLSNRVRKVLEYEKHHKAHHTWIGIASGFFIQFCQSFYDLYKLTQSKVVADTSVLITPFSWAFIWTTVLTVLAVITFQAFIKSKNIPKYDVEDMLDSIRSEYHTETSIWETYQMNGAIISKRIDDVE